MVYLVQVSRDFIMSSSSSDFSSSEEAEDSTSQSAYETSYYDTETSESTSSSESDTDSDEEEMETEPAIRHVGETPLYDGAQINVLESYILMLQFALKHTLTKKGLRRTPSSHNRSFTKRGENPQVNL